MTSPPCLSAAGSGGLAMVDRRVLVTGGAGFIGSHVVRRLSEQGATVLVVDLQWPVDLPPRATFACVDVRDAALVETTRMFGADAVVHLAAQVSVPRSVSFPTADADVNISGTTRAAEAAAAAGAQLVFAASCAVYGVPRRLPVTEAHPLTPHSPYGMSKAAALMYLDLFTRDRGLEATSLVLGNVYGPSVHGRPQPGVIGAFVADALAGRPSTVHGTGGSTRDFVHVDDVVDAVLAACTTPVAGRFNIATGTETSVRDVLALVARATGEPRAQRHEAPRDGDVPRMRLDVSRARELLGWQPRTDLGAGVAALIQNSTGAEMGQ